MLLAQKKPSAGNRWLGNDGGLSLFVEVQQGIRIGIVACLLVLQLLNLILQLLNLTLLSLQLLL